MNHREFRRAAVVSALTSLLLVPACGGSSTAPTPPSNGPIVSSINPNSGPSIGGTAVTISGQRFDATASVTIGGAEARNVTLVSANTLTAVTGSRNIGVVDVAVTVGGQRGVLANGFTYTAAGAVANAPPVISNLRAVGGANQPSGFAESAGEITASAVVTDAETPDTGLVYEWTADAGTFTGTGASVRWKAPAISGPPVTARLTLTVIERYTSSDSSGNPVASEHRVSAATTVSVHDSVKEVGELATAFLTDFSTSSVSPEAAVRHFYTGCPGRQDELADIRDNRAQYLITAYDLGTPTVTIDFGGVCPFRSRTGDACISLSCEWDSTTRATGEKGTARGTCFLTSVYRESKWQLCDSNFQGQPGIMSQFMR
jgi:IPT/TIG domain